MTHKHLILILALILAACTSDPFDNAPQEVAFCLREVWHDGRAPEAAAHTVSKANRYDALTRTAPIDALLAPGGADIIIPTTEYPAAVNVHCSDGTDFTLTKGATLCTEHGDYWQYTPSVIYKDKKIERDNLTFTATATIEPSVGTGDILTGTATKDDLHDQHLQFTLHHQRALLRFVFRVNANYLKLRDVKITSIALKDNSNNTIADIIPKECLLTSTLQVIGYAYIDPAVVTTSTLNTLLCTYDIFDKDPSINSEQVSDAHLTRKDVTATNTFRLNSLRDNSDTPITTILAGYYYDLNITLNPDYLYVLSEHDNKHIVIN